MPGRPLQLDFDAAIEHLRGHVGALAARLDRPHAVVGVAGPPGAGKSHLARSLVERAGGLVVTTDDYLPDYDATPEHLRDLPESSDLERLASDLAALARGEAALVPEWSFKEHRRVGRREVRASGVIVCEGLHALHERVRRVLDLCVLVEASAGTRWARVERRERAGERGWTVEYAKEFFETVADPTFARYAPGYRGVADVIVRNERG
ncbi:MAG: AAA family ATPase [Phycisphaerales bacterium]